MGAWRYRSRLAVGRVAPEGHMLDLWYENAVIYNLDVETFQDGNGDGIGDFGGLTRRLDYLAGLGVTCIWLAPFYPTPNRDNGYDVMDYYGVDPRLGDLGDFVVFMGKARERGIRVIVDFVMNHTSIEHPWFRAAREDPSSPYRDYYVWSERKPEDADEGIVFPGVQETTWTYDEKAGAYYFHRFYAHQADLNIANPAVRDEIRKVMGFWLELGVSGFRVDAAPFLIELKGLEGVEVSEPYEYLKEFRDYLSWQRGDAIMLAEANVSTDEAAAYFGGGDKLQMLFDFVLNQHVMLALARGTATPIAEGLRLLPSIPETGQWANFLRNHDELALDQLDRQEREEVLAAFAPDASMRVYGQGVRRRLPPMLDGDARRLELAHSLLFSLPGTPVLRYGEEIGMGEDLSLPERNSVRTPMQWSDAPNGGFSSAPSDELIRPVIDDGRFGYRKVNVDRQQRDRDSLLSVTERMIRLRKESPELGRGAWRIVETGDPRVLAHRCDGREGTVIAVHNLSGDDTTVTLDLGDDEGRELITLIGGGADEERKRSAGPIELAGYGYRWFRLVE